MYLIACPTDGAHVAEADAEWLRELVNDGLGAIQHQRIARLHKRTAEQLGADLEELKADAARTTLLAYGTHKPGCGGLTSTTGRACECGWIQVRDLAKAQEVIDG